MGLKDSIRQDIGILENLLKNAKENSGKKWKRQKFSTKSDGKRKIDQKGKEIAQQSLIDDTSSQIISLLNKKKVSISDNPKYFKPAFLLDTLSPFLKVEIMLFDDYGDPVYINLFDDKDDPDHNHLKSFKYEIAKAGQVEINLVDVDQNILEILAMRFALLNKVMSGGASDSNIILIIEFGWHVPQSLKNEYKGKVAFTKKVTAKFLKLTANYTPEGVLEMTIIGSVDSVLPPPYHEFSPFKTLGKSPAASITLISLLQFIEAVWSPYYKKSWETISSNDQKKLMLLTARYFYFQIGIKDTSAIKESVRAIIDYYFATKPENELNSILSTKSIAPKGIKTFKQSVSSSRTKLLSENDKLLNKIENISKLTSSYKLLIQGLTESETTTSDLGSILKEKDPLKLLKERTREKGEISKKQSGYKLRKLLLTLAPIAQNILIHPWLVFNYVIKKFEEAIISFNNTLDIRGEDLLKIQLTHLMMFDPRNIEPVGAIKPKSGKEESVSKDITLEEYEIDYNKLDTHASKKWCHPANSYNCGATSYWHQYLQSILEKVFVQFEGGKKYYEKLDKPNVKKNEQKPKGSPARLKVTSLLMDNDAAVENINLVRNLFRAKSALKEESKSKVEYSPAPSDILTDEKVIEKHIEDVRRRIISNNERVIFLVSDFMAADKLFDPRMGQQQIVQAYSYRAGNIPTDPHTFNPGWPTVWDINFPDVISFSPGDLNYWTALQNIVTNADAVIDEAESKEHFKTNKLAKLRNEFLEKVDEINKFGRPGIKKYKKKRETAIQNATDLLKQYRAEIEKDVPADYSPYGVSKPVRFNVDFEQRSIYTGNVGDALQNKKQLQEFRRQLVLRSLQFEADMQVFGDPSFELFDIGNRYIFLKFIKKDGTLGIFTGLYMIQNITQEISAGNFTTTFKLRFLPKNGAPEASAEINDMWTKYDKTSILDIE